jgi:hypothetical protein
VGHDDRGIFLLRVVVGRGIDVGGNVQAAQPVLDRVDADLARPACLRMQEQDAGPVLSNSAAMASEITPAS